MLKNSLRTALATASLTIPALALNAPGALASGQQDFNVYNRTSSNITALWVAPIDYNGTVPNLLDAAIPSGGSTSITFPSNVSSCYFDIKADFSNGTYLEYDRVDLCSITNVFFP